MKATHAPICLPMLNTPFGRTVIMPTGPFSSLATKAGSPISFMLSAQG